MTKLTVSEKKGLCSERCGLLHHGLKEENRKRDLPTVFPRSTLIASNKTSSELKNDRRQVMGKCSTKTQKIYVGFDVSEKKIAVFAVCGTKTSAECLEISNDAASIKQFLSVFSEPKEVCIVMETGTHSLWMSEMIRELGFEVIVAHARDLALIYGSDKKNDKLDAERLARLAQADKKLLHPVEHMTMERQTDLMVVKARDLVVRQRIQTINSIRGFLRANGCKMIEAEYTADSLKKCCSALPAEIKPAIAPLLQHIYYCDQVIKDYDRQIRKLCKKYPETDILRQIPGVGELTALSFVLIIGNPRRFQNASRLCAYLGLVPRQDQSGNTDKQLGITKKGNKLGRRLLIQAAHYIMGPFGKECDLRTFGLRIQSRGGDAAKKKSFAAVARKLVTVMFALWMHPDIPYTPNFKKERNRKAAA